MTKPKQGVSSTKKNSPKPQMLKVKDADSLQEFLRNARIVWRKSHPFFNKRRGRPSYIRDIIGAIEQAEKAGEIGGNPSQGKIIQLVKKYLRQSEPSKDTIRPYVKTWYLAKFKGVDGITEEDWEWLERKNLWEFFMEMS